MNAMTMDIDTLAVVELSDDEIMLICGGQTSVIGDAIRAVGEVGQKIVDTAYNAGYMLGKAIRDATS